MGESMKTTWIGNVQSGQYDNKDVELKGWIKRSRGSNKIRFLVLRDSTGTIQCVAKREAVGDDCFEEIKTALIESSIILKNGEIPANCPTVFLPFGHKKGRRLGSGRCRPRAWDLLHPWRNSLSAVSIPLPGTISKTTLSPSTCSWKSTAFSSP